MNCAHGTVRTKASASLRETLEPAFAGAGMHLHPTPLSGTFVRLESSASPPRLKRVNTLLLRFCTLMRNSYSLTQESSLAHISAIVRRRERIA